MAEAATLDMGVITRGFRSALDETAGQFKKASNENSLNVNKIVKDLGTMFKAQRADIDELTNAVQESVSEAQQTGSRIEAQSSIFRETLSYQVDMSSSLKTIASNIKILNDSVVSLGNQLIGTGPNSLLGGLLNPSDGVGTRVAEALAAAGLFAAAGYGANQMMGSSGADVPGIKTGGTLAQNQQEAYKAARAEGLSDKAARIAVANVSGENLKDPGKVYNDPSIRNPGQKAHGIVAWDDERSARIKSVFGKYPQEMSVADQTKAYIWEMKTHYKKAYNDLVNENLSEQQRLASVVANFEKPKDIPGSVSNRMGFLKGFTPSETAASTTSAAATPTTPTNSQQQEAPPPSATATRYEGPGTGHGPIAGAMHGEKTEGSAALPSGDIVALGHALEKMGMRISEHPQFGGVKPVHKGKAHYEGRAIDINFGEGKVEANDPVMGAKFDQLADQLTKMGYKVYWRESGPYAAAGHNNHLHAEIPRGGEKSTPDTYQLAGTPEQRAMQGATPSAGATPASGPSMGAPGPTPEAAHQVSAAPISAGVSSQIPPQAMNMMNQMMPMMGGMGGIGGIIGSLMPMIGSLLGSLGQMDTQTPQQFGQQDPIAELLQSLSGGATGEMMNQAAVQKQAQQESSQEMMTAAQQPQPRGAETNIASNVMSAGGDGYGYNYPADVGWPEWASMIGGNHWAEMKKYKQNMWG